MFSGKEDGWVVCVREWYLTQRTYTVISEDYVDYSLGDLPKHVMFSQPWLAGWEPTGHDRGIDAIVINTLFCQ